MREKDRLIIKLDYVLRLIEMEYNLESDYFKVRGKLFEILNEKR